MRKLNVSSNEVEIKGRLWGKSREMKGQQKQACKWSIFNSEKQGKQLIGGAAGSNAKLNIKRGWNLKRTKKFKVMASW